MAESAGSTKKFVLQNLKDAPKLLGVRDKFASILEDGMNVSINLRGTTIKVSGKNDRDTNLPVAIFKHILNLLHQGIALHSSDFVSAMKMAKGGTLDYFEGLYDKILIYDHKGHPVRVKNFGQREYVQAVKNNDITFGIGPAGTGKTYLAVVMAVAELKAGKVDKIVLTRPAVEAGESLGYLPGDLREKIDPYLRPIYDALFSIIGADHTRRLMDRGVIEIAPLAYMRGRTLNSSFVILDEAQNTTNAQMKMFLTRLGFGSKMIVNGDISQIDLPKSKPSGLVQAQTILKDVKSIRFVRFTSQDVVRHPIVARIINAYEKHHK
ncbi:MAG: PhoH family protein [Acetilactobacillus jinshanensis]